ncbi:hypothetical protein P7K49_003309 [Saguinus oedipus]|uniref:Selenoprotein O n=1 Tax=Saguinus oedipus TaxID=9490 RepID=A0ABQ9WJT4_SAGOE|nr:hypothetical protein P7K49_003309 [Saguinus oedipus]
MPGLSSPAGPEAEARNLRCGVGKGCEIWGSQVAVSGLSPALLEPQGGVLQAGRWCGSFGITSPADTGADSPACPYLGTHPGADKGCCWTCPMRQGCPGPLPLQHSLTVPASAVEARPGQDRLLRVFRPIFIRGCANNLLGVQWLELGGVPWDGLFSVTRAARGSFVLSLLSVQADGRKVLRSSIREFLCSEAMFHLGVPTTRAGACVTSESTAVRDVFYDGNPKYEKCTVVLRIAATFLRFGSFEIFKSADEHSGRAGPSVGRNDIRVQLLDYVISSFYPEIQAAHASDSVQRNAAFFREVSGLHTIPLQEGTGCPQLC